MNCCIRQAILLRKCKWFQSLGHIGRNNYRLPSIQWEHGRGTHGALAAEIITEIPFPNKPYHLFQLILLREHKRALGVSEKMTRGRGLKPRPFYFLPRRQIIQEMDKPGAVYSDIRSDSAWRDRNKEAYGVTQSWG